MTQFDGAADAYADLVGPRFEAIAGLIRSQVGSLPPASGVLEIAIGTGVLTRLMSADVLDSGGSWLGVDISADMLRVARRDLDPRVGLLLADAGELPLPDGSVDVVVSSLGPVPETVERFAQVRRVLRPGGLLAITLWDAGYAEREMLRAPRRLMAAPEFPEDPSADARARAESAGLADVHTTVVGLDAVHDDLDRYLAFRRAFGRPPFVDADRVEEWFDLVREAASHYTDAEGRVVLDWRVAVLTAHRPR